MLWKEEKMLVIADLHVGKTQHFRNAGIGIPREVSHQNWRNLTTLLLNHDIETCLFLGDLIHSDYNSECETLFQILDQFDSISFVLTEGNHDIYSKQVLSSKNLLMVDQFIKGPFVFTHIPLEDEHELYNFSGHIHPAVRMKGKGRQYLRLPCFHFGHRLGLLPAFGSFTGSKTIHPQESDIVYVCTSQKVIRVQ